MDSSACFFRCGLLLLYKAGTVLHLRCSIYYQPSIAAVALDFRGAWESARDFASRRQMRRGCASFGLQLDRYGGQSGSLRRITPHKLSLF